MVFFQIPVQKPKKNNFCPKFKNFYFSIKLCMMKNSRFSKMKTVFSNSSLKIPKRKILGEKSKVLFT